MAIEVTEKAAVHAARLREQEGAPPGSFLRVGVKGGGCSGFSYVLRFESAPRADDLVIDRPPIQVLVDPKSMMLLDGMVLDYSDGLMGQGLVFQNPQAKSTCGCGKSFGT